MGNTNMELDQRIQKLERQLEAFKTTIEPKSWEFIWQHWYNTATEVLNVWNWKQFSPAYGNSIIKDLEWFETRLTQTENTIAFDVVKDDEVISKINLSLEWIRIRRSKIYIDWSVNFASWYNPSQKVATWWAASDINTYTTTINGGKITTNSITADRMNVSSLSAISANIWTITAGTITWLTINWWTITWSTFKTSWDFWKIIIDNTNWWTIKLTSTYENTETWYIKTKSYWFGIDYLYIDWTWYLWWAWSWVEINWDTFVNNNLTIWWKLKIPVWTNLY